MTSVLITGCSSGIGLETALAFARRGDRVHACVRDPESAGELLRRATAEGLTLDVPRLDVTDDASVAAAVGGVLERHGAIDVLVNNAGIDRTGAVETMPQDEARAVLETNLWGPLRTVRAVLPGMRARGSGVVVNVSSLAGRTFAVPHGGFYAASKAALGTLSEALSAEVAPFGIRVVCLEPGSYASRINREGTAGAAPSQPSAADPYAADLAWTARFLARVQEGAGDCGEVAEAVLSAVDDPGTPLHTPVGKDAETALQYLGTASYEQWLPLFLQQAQSLVGPRPGADGV
ncbi:MULTISPECIES: SDR family oxidoreductase [Streptomyces]|uniref:SDR family oxidoreductase n=2 Tax=Streptomyces TaxID=1883 RepID=A0ABU2RDY2_9ACTN|nr:MULTISPECIES: SDR family oxidoreductase [unclassified Streptomyces]MBK3592460.1 SDR family oxidoreductase [Streptomyces sp. MBT51]MDT0427055.1 SDR family oxidoreductase [Streptomyces sp. DSM 41770]HBF80982.1 oxidoreductase [Streptomyces sp.]